MRCAVCRNDSKLNPMKFHYLIYLLISNLFFNCSASIPKVKSVLQLTPPQNVRQIKQNEEHKIIWEASSDETKPGFAGYNVYFSNKSLIFTAIKNLPVPVELDKTAHEFLPGNTDSVTFLHVRSRNTKGEISLPSLPEIKFKSVE